MRNIRAILCSIAITSLLFCGCTQQPQPDISEDDEYYTSEEDKILKEKTIHDSPWYFLGEDEEEKYIKEREAAFEYAKTVQAEPGQYLSSCKIIGHPDFDIDGEMTGEELMTVPVDDHRFVEISYDEFFKFLNPSYPHQFDILIMFDNKTGIRYNHEKKTCSYDAINSLDTSYTNFMMINDETDFITVQGTIKHWIKDN
jgi:hypothetical protein